MSDFVPPPAPAAVAAARPSRSWLLLVAVAVLALVVGAGAATSVLLLTGWRKPVDREFLVTVFVDQDITAAQQAAVRAEMAKLPVRDGVRFESQDEAFAKFKEVWKDQPDRITGVRAGDLPASFQVTVVGAEFDCAPLRGIRALPGVEKPVVMMTPTKTAPGGELGCY